jgi:hypothetical protein
MALHSSPSFAAQSTLRAKAPGVANVTITAEQSQNACHRIVLNKERMNLNSLTNENTNINVQQDLIQGEQRDNIQEA